MDPLHLLTQCLKIDTMFKVQIPKGTKIHIGDISYQDGFYMGGTHQIVIPNAKKYLV